MTIGLEFLIIASIIALALYAIYLVYDIWRIYHDPEYRKRCVEHEFEKWCKKNRRGQFDDRVDDREEF